MLEQEIKGLKDEIALLRESIRVLTYSMGAGQVPVLEDPFKSLPEEKAEDKIPFDPTVTPDEIQTLCMSIVRKDRTKKQPIKDLLAEYGAELVKDVPEAKLPELKTKLEAL